MNGPFDFADVAGPAAALRALPESANDRLAERVQRGESPLAAAAELVRRGDDRGLRALAGAAAFAGTMRQGSACPCREPFQPKSHQTMPPRMASSKRVTRIRRMDAVVYSSASSSKVTAMRTSPRDAPRIPVSSTSPR